MKVWRLDPQRAEECRQIRLEMLALAPEAFATKLHEWQDRPLADFAARLADVRVFAAGRVVGEPVATAGWHEDQDKSAWISAVFCRPEGRGQGFAAAAMQKVEEDARDHGMARCILRVFNDNLEAWRFYERAGYSVVPAQADGDPGLIAMEKPLQA
ncbi:GNAT family N-acetyltransferase [Paracoccus sulfuroxidans]|uniref:Acetyltransferase (GNAT) family protein n=1 Tax=Paracoccus sulfuroxidans TaxID=384678 RepID=A0A562NB55_9RHOB|nr:GNAT family N-acetyltransferase [Paracoccus sulfuroxidans]TWI29386.1 acetyltransferase (GNAT) family protein [Paracoccus sulfuroxidans]